MRSKLELLVKSRRYWWIVAGAFISSRVATFLFPFDSDHWIFYYVGRRWLEGDILYLQVWDHKSPLIFAINSAMHATLGGNIVWHRIFFGLIAVLTIWVFYLTARLVFDRVSKLDATLNTRVATLVFAVFGSLSQFTNSGNNTENFGVLALLLAAYCYLRWRQSQMWKWLLYSGVAVSCLVFLKANFAILLLPLFIDLFISQRRSFRRLATYSVIWLLPVVIQAGLWMSYFIPRNLVREFMIATFSFNSKYLQAGWAGNLSGQLVFLTILAAGFLFFAGGYYFLLKQWRKDNLLLISIALSAILFCAILGTFYTHYYLVVMPYFSLVFGFYWRRVLSSRFWALMTIASLVLSFGISLKQLFNRFYGEVANETVNMAAAADYVKSHTDKSDKIVFYGYGATFYRLAERDSGTRYISASHPLIDEREGFGYDFTGKYIGDLAVSKPKYFVIDQSSFRVYGQNTKITDYAKKYYQPEIILPGYEIWKIK